MLTVKLVEPNGNEQMWEVEQVWAVPVGHGDHAVRFLWRSLEQGCLTTCLGTYGNVYVMNSEGKTISRYTLPSE